MTLSPLAGKPAPKEMLIAPASLEREYYDERHLEAIVAEAQEIVSKSLEGR